MNTVYDVIIVGTGAAGLFCALNFPETKKVCIITKRRADEGAISASIASQIP